MTELKTLLNPISEFVSGLDATDPEACEKALNESFPPDSDAVQAIRSAAFQALADGELCQKGEPGMQFSRIAKTEETPGGSSIDAVFMDDAAGPPHTHPNGEYCLCFGDQGTPTFEDRSDTWIVLGSGSHHTPTVKNGRMLILYWLPEGAVTWG